VRARREKPLDSPVEVIVLNVQDKILSSKPSWSGKITLPEVEINGVKINYVATGKGTEAIVFVHGLGENLESWKHQLETFSKVFKVVGLDLRGHGKSGVPKKKIKIGQSNTFYYKKY